MSFRKKKKRFALSPKNEKKRKREKKRFALNTKEKREALRA